MAISPPRPAVDEAWALLGRLFRDHLRPRLLGLAAELELSPPQLQALYHLGDADPIPMNSLAGHLHCDNSNVTGIIDRLEDRGLVERRAGERDRRVKLLVLTEEGRRLRAQIAERMETPPEPLQRLSAAEATRLRDLMAKALG